MIGFITQDGLASQWSIVFYFLASTYALSAIFFLIYGSGDVQYWAEPKVQLELKTKSGSTEKVQKESVA